MENHVQNVKSDGQIGVRERIARIRTAESRLSVNERDRETVTRNGNGSERTPVKTKEASGYHAGTSNAETTVQTTGRQKAVRERLKRVSERHPNAETGENRIPQKETPVLEKVSQTAEAPQTVTPNGEKTIRERTIQIAERRPENGHAVQETSAQIRTNVPETKESATVTPSKREPTPDRIRAKLLHPETPSDVRKSPRIATKDGQNIMREHAAEIRTDQTENRPNLWIRTKSPDAETLPRTSPQETMSVRMREADIRQKDSPGTPRNSAQSGQKAVRERVEEISGGPIFQPAKPEAIPPRQSETPRLDNLVKTDRKEKSVPLVEQKREPPTTVNNLGYKFTER